MLSVKSSAHAALAGVVAIILASCGGDDGTGSAAATVNGTDIAAGDVDAQADLMSENPATQQQYPDADEEQLDQQLRANALNRFIIEVILEEGAEELGVEVTEEDIQESRAEIAQQFGGEDALYTQLEEQGVDREEVDRQLELSALQEAMIAELGPGVAEEEVREAYETGTPARHILVEEEQQANQIFDRIEGGEDFAAVAEEESTDGTAQQGGDLGFVQPDTTVPAFEEALFDAEAGELVGPVESEFGFHVIERLEKPEFEEVEEEIRGQLEQQTTQQGQTALQEFLNERLQEAEVEVNSEYGEWDAESGQVVPENPIQPPQPQQPAPGDGGTGEPQSTEEPQDGSGE